MVLNNYILVKRYTQNPSMSIINFKEVTGNPQKTMRMGLPIPPEQESSKFLCYWTIWQSLHIVEHLNGSLDDAIS